MYLKTDTDTESLIISREKIILLHSGAQRCMCIRCATMWIQPMGACVALATRDPIRVLSGVVKLKWSWHIPVNLSPEKKGKKSSWLRGRDARNSSAPCEVQILAFILQLKKMIEVWLVELGGRIIPKCMILNHIEFENVWKVHFVPMDKSPIPQDYNHKITTMLFLTNLCICITPSKTRNFTWLRIQYTANINLPQTHTDTQTLKCSNTMALFIRHKQLNAVLMWSLC